MACPNLHVRLLTSRTAQEDTVEVRRFVVEVLADYTADKWPVLNKGEGLSVPSWTLSPVRNQ